MTNSDPISAGMGSGPVAVVPAERGAEARARAVARQLDVAVQRDNHQTASVILYVGHDDLWLQRADVAQASPVRVDFASPRLQHRRRSGHNELLGRAVGVKAGESPRVVDATAGLGRDAYVLGDLGCEVTLVERSPVLALLLAHALERARISSVESVRAAAARMCLRQADSCSLAVPEGVVIYLDPMFSQRRGSAAAKKDLSVLQALHSATDNEDSQLFEWAMAQPARRVVVKRPSKAPPLQQRQPSHAIMGKAIRFDVYAR
ncbi:MAG: class I SAM-dependent methyltransferase [Luminiphilus sp.]